MITMTARAVITSVSCSDTPVLVNVAVSADIAPAIQAIARSFNNQNVMTHGRCAEVQVTEGDSAAQASQIDGQVSSRGLAPADAWIPDSSLWVDVVRTYPVGAQVVQPTGRSVARSPLMLVTTAAVAARTHVFDTPPAWNVLLPPSAGGPPASLGLSVDLPDPTDSSSGLATLIQVSRVLGSTSAARTAFTQFVFDSEATENFDSASALQQFVASTRAPFNRQAVTVASEQAVLAYDKASKAPLAARYPAGSSAAVGEPGTRLPLRADHLESRDAAGSNRLRQLSADQLREVGHQVLRLQGRVRRSGRHAVVGGAGCPAAATRQRADAPARRPRTCRSGRNSASALAT